MVEFEEFAEALIDQIGVELSEEKEIMQLATKISEDPKFGIRFEPIEDIVGRIFVDLKSKITEFTGIKVSDGVTVEFPELEELKVLKGKKVFATKGAREYVDELFEAISREDKMGISKSVKKDTAKFLTYSTYAKSYISKITTTYGDYLESKIYLNKFVLSRYPQIILYKRGSPYERGFDTVNSGYVGALKMTVLEELVHATQGNLHEVNRDAVTKVNELNEELAGIILALDDQTAMKLTDHLQLQAVPDDFPIARRANLFFMLNPDNFIMNALGPDVLTFTRVEIDPKISEFVPQLLDVYQRWLGPIQTHEATFATMEGMAAFCVENILTGDRDFAEYLRTFTDTDVSTYRTRKSIGKDFVKTVFERLGGETFERIIKEPPTTFEIKDPQMYLDRVRYQI